jgi:uncharacterized membrane protein
MLNVGHRRMEGGQYILPGELAVLIAFLLAPPLAVGLTGQLWYLKMQGVTKVRIGLSMLATTGITVALVLMIAVVAPSLVPSALGVQDVFIGSAWMPVLPLAFVAVAAIAPLVSLLAARKR